MLLCSFIVSFHWNSVEGNDNMLPFHTEYNYWWKRANFSSSCTEHRQWKNKWWSEEMPKDTWLWSMHYFILSKYLTPNGSNVPNNMHKHTQKTHCIRSIVCILLFIAFQHSVSHVTRATSIQYILQKLCIHSLTVQLKIPVRFPLTK